MHSKKKLESNLALYEKKEHSSESEDDDEAGNQIKFDKFPFKPSKPSQPSKSKNPRRILKPSKMLEKSSFEESVSKSRFFKKSHLQLDEQDISEIEKVSMINKSEDFVQQVKDTTEPETATGIPNFGFLAKFSPRKKEENDESLDISSPIAQSRPQTVIRQDTDDLKIDGLIATMDQGKNEPRLLRIPLTEQQELMRNSRSATDRTNFNETPLFKMDREQPLFDQTIINPNSLSALNHEENQGIDFWAREDRGAKMAYSLVIDSSSKRSNDTVQSRSNMKKTAGFFEGNKLSQFNKASAPAGLNEVSQHENPNQQTPIPRLTEKEIVDTFNSIDINKDGYITADEIACFFEVLEESATDAEIDEMIRMLDFEGSGRVRFEDFYKLATGQDLSSNRRVSIPDANKNHDISKLDRINDNTVSYFMNKDSFVGIMKRDSISISDSTTFLKDYDKLDRKTSKNNFQRKESQSVVEFDKKERATYLKEFLRQTGLDENNYLEKYPKSMFSNSQNTFVLSYKEFLTHFQLKDGDLPSYVFSLFSRDKSFVDLRQILIAININLGFSLEDKISLAYDFYDTEDNGYILYNEAIKILTVFQMGDDPKKIEKKLQTILKKINVIHEDSISREEFFLICESFPNLIRF